MTWPPVKPPVQLAPMYAGTGGGGSGGGGGGGTGPAFIASRTATQSITGGSPVKVQFATEVADTAGVYDDATNYRFTPNVAGYYHVEGTVSYTGFSTNSYVMIYKNGSEEIRGTQTDANLYQYRVGGLVYLNGSTDYIEVYAFTGSTRTINGHGPSNRFSAFLAR